MSTFDDLVLDAQPCLFITHETEGTEGRSWDFGVILSDADGVEYDFPTLMAGGTAVCRLLDGIDGDVLVTFSVTFPGGGEIRWTATPANTAGVGGASKIKEGKPWHMTLTNSAGRQVDVFGVQESRLIVNQGA